MTGRLCSVSREFTAHYAYYYTTATGATGPICTADAGFFKPALYSLSYSGAFRSNSMAVRTNQFAFIDFL